MKDVPWIVNVSLADVANGNHPEPGPNSTLIQIVDPDMEFPTPARNFACVKQYKFLDLEEDGPSVETLGIQPSQAACIADDLKRALLIGGNVVVHCHAGVCRSGAVAEAGVMLGFRDLHVYRKPNSFVKKLLRLCLGLKYSFEK